MKKIKVLWIFTGGMRRNGICVSQLDYYKKIDKNKFQVDVLAVHNNEKEMIDTYKNEGCKVYELPDRKKQLLKYLKALKNLLTEEKYSIVHVHGSSTLMFLELSIAKKCGCNVRIAHSRNTSCDRPWLEKFLRRKFESSYNVALSCGDDAGKWLFKDRDFIIIHNGKDLYKYQFNSKVRNNMRKTLHLNDDDIAIGHVGVFNEQKNHTFLIDVFYEIYKEHKNAKLFLMGMGPKIEEIKTKVKQLQLNDVVTFCGSVSNIENYLQAMDIMLFPSLFEGLPNVVIEWQATGLPCIISDAITEECAACDLVEFLPITEGTQCWKDEFEKLNKKTVIERKDTSERACELLKEKGFELETNTKRIEELYSSLVKKVDHNK